MNTARSLDQEITQYLTQLNTKQKEAVLTVVKTFVEEQQEYDYWNDKSFIAELDRRTTEFEKGKAKVYTLDELEAGARESFKERKRSRK